MFESKHFFIPVFFCFFSFGHQKPHILVFDSHPENIASIAELPVSITAFQTKNDVDNRLKKAVDRIVKFDYSDIESAYTEAERIHAIQPFTGVISFRELGILPAATLKERLKISGNDIYPVTVTRNKLLMRQTLDGKGDGLGAVRYSDCSNREQIEAFYHAVKIPIIVKNLSGVGKDGIFMVRALDDIDQIVALSKSYPDGFICEEFIAGPEFSVESMTVDGKHEILAITAKTNTGTAPFIEYGHSLPAELSPDRHQEIVTFTKNFLDAIKQSFGPAHTELRMSASGPRIIESHTRAGGDFIWEMVKLVTGADMVKEPVAVLAGLPQSTRKKTYEAAQSSAFFLEKGTVRDISGIELAEKTNGVIRLFVSLKAGQEIGALKTNYDRQGFIVVGGSSPEDARQSLRNAASKIRINFDGDIIAPPGLINADCQ